MPGIEYEKINIFHQMKSQRSDMSLERKTSKRLVGEPNLQDIDNSLNTLSHQRQLSQNYYKKQKSSVNISSHFNQNQNAMHDQSSETKSRNFNQIQ